MESKKFFFVAGDQCIVKMASTLMDAWLSIEIRATNKNAQPVAREFYELPIEAYDGKGKLLVTDDWKGWHDAALRDTYGDGWKQVLDVAALKLKY